MMRAAFLLGLFVWALAPRAYSQAPNFEVASIKPNPGCENLSQPQATFSPSPGRLELPCVNLQALIRYAYLMFQDGQTADLEPLRLEGGPHWMQTEYFALSAKSDGYVRTEMLAGPMLQGLLEERFQLKLRRKKREVPVYALVVAKGGVKAPPVPQGSCAQIDLSHPPHPGEPQPVFCGTSNHGTTSRGTVTFELRGGTMAQFAQRLSARVDRTVIDKTGRAGMFDFNLEYALDSPPAGSGVEKDAGASAGPNIFEALQEQIGVKLVPEKSLAGFLVVERVERLSEN